MKDRANELDAFIGERIRIARIAADISQAEIGKLLGVTFQQIQKYENGTSRIAARDLNLISQELGHPVTYFLPTARKRSKSESIEERYGKFLATKEGQKIADLFPNMPKPHRDAIVDFITALAT